MTNFLGMYTSIDVVTKHLLKFSQPPNPHYQVEEYIMKLGEGLESNMVKLNQTKSLFEWAKMTLNWTEELA